MPCLTNNTEQANNPITTKIFATFLKVIEAKLIFVNSILYFSYSLNAEQSSSSLVKNALFEWCYDCYDIYSSGS